MNSKLLSTALIALSASAPAVASAAPQNPREGNRPTYTGNREQIYCLPATGAIPQVCAHYATAAGAHAPNWADDGPGAFTPDIDVDCEVTEDVDFPGAKNGVPDAAETALYALQRAYQRQVIDLGWPAPPGDGTKGMTGTKAIASAPNPAANAIDVYLRQLPDANGQVSGDEDQADPIRNTAFIEMDSMHECDEDPVSQMQSTIGHEFNHVLQNGINAQLWDSWMVESIANWIDEIAEPAFDRWQPYVENFAVSPWVPVTVNEGWNPDPELDWPRSYGLLVWNDWLATRYGNTLIRDAYTRSVELYDARSDGPQSAVDAYGNVLRTATGIGGTDLSLPVSRELAAFAAATAEWGTRSAGFSFAADLAANGQEVVRSGSLAVGAAESMQLDHGSYRLYDVPARSGSVIASATFPAGTRGAVALVGRRGADVVVRLSQTDAGGSVTTQGLDLAGFDRATAVVVNSDLTFDGGHWVQTGPTEDDTEWLWKWKRDKQPVTLSLAPVAAPAPVVDNGSTGNTITIPQPPATPRSLALLTSDLRSALTALKAPLGSLRLKRTKFPVRHAFTFVEAGKVTFSWSIPSSQARKLGLAKGKGKTVVIATGSASGGPRQQVGVGVRLNANGRKVLRRVGKRLRITVEATYVGATATAKASVKYTLKR